MTEYRYTLRDCPSCDMSKLSRLCEGGKYADNKAVCLYCGLDEELSEETDNETYSTMYFMWGDKQYFVN